MKPIARRVLGLDYADDVPMEPARRKGLDLLYWNAAIAMFAEAAAANYTNLYLIALRATNTYSVPRRPSYLVLNMWSDGGEWSGDMDVGGSAELQIQWIEMVFNTSGPVEGPDGGDEKRRKVKRGVGEEADGALFGGGDGGLGSWLWRSMGAGGVAREASVLGKRKEKRCDVVCRVDGVNVTGFPEIAHVSGAPAGLAPAVTGWVLVLVIGLITAVTGIY